VPAIIPARLFPTIYSQVLWNYAIDSLRQFVLIVLVNDGGFWKNSLHVVALIKQLEIKRL